MLIKISDSAQAYLNKRIAFYRSSLRVPRIILAERSCSGAVIRLFFDARQEGDILVEAGATGLYIPSALLDEFTGFELDAEQFFFFTRLRITPMKQSFKCNCDTKCNNPTTMVSDTKGT